MVKELTPTQSYKKVKELLKEKKKITKKDFFPGNLIFTFYNAKYKEFPYDRTPLILILKRNNSHTLGLNFHWLPLKYRLNLIRIIMKMNKENIKEGKPIQFSYQDLKPMLKKFGYAPCIRLYINKRIGPTGLVIPPDRLLEIARLKTEIFTNGKYTAEQMFKMAHLRAKKSRRKQ